MPLRPNYLPVTIYQQDLRFTGKEGVYLCHSDSLFKYHVRAVYFMRMGDVIKLQVSSSRVTKDFSS